MMVDMKWFNEKVYVNMIDYESNSSILKLMDSGYIYELMNSACDLIDQDFIS